MKLLRVALLSAVALLVVFAAMNTSDAAQRCVFFEDFTNASCPPCAAVNPSLRTMLHAVGEDTVCAVSYHVWWPGVDPMYNLNTSEVQTRVNYYNWSPLGVPHVRLDGTWSITPSTGNVTTIRNTIRSHYFQTSPCTIEFAALATGETSVTVIGTITAEEDMLSPNLRLFAILVSDTQQYTSPPGSNGETLFPHVFRDFWPGATGETFMLSAGETYEFNGTLNRQAAWDIDNLTVLVFVQDYTTKQVHQAARASVTQNYGMVTETSDLRQRMVDVNAGEVQYFVELTNIGMLDDTYDVTLGGTFPTGWSHSIEASAVPGDPNSIQVPLGSLQTTTLLVRVNPNGFGGSANFEVNVTTPNEPLLSARESFRMMGGLDILIVDDDEGAQFETYYEDALAAANTDFIYGRWDVAMNAMDAAYLTGLDAVVWYTGSVWQDGHTLSAQDQIMLQDYLDQGGRLLLSGQGVGLDCRTDQFYADYLHSVFRQPNVLEHHILGIAGDPISDGLDFQTAGGDGANNQSHQSSQDPDESGYASALFDWENPPAQGGHPAIKIDNGISRIVYLGFGLEGIDNAEDRTAVMENSINWITGTTSAHDPNELVPGEFALGQNYPNPFNPETTLPYMLPARADVTLHVFDVLGREVATLAQGTQEAGAHAVNWNASALSSGIYFYRLEAAMNGNVQQATRKLMLLK